MADPAPIVATNVSHSYGNGSMRREVLQDINFRVDPGEVVLLTGPSGCGKTTLLTLVGALRSLQHGQLQVLGVPLAQAGRGERRRLRQRPTCVWVLISNGFRASAGSWKDFESSCATFTLGFP